MAPRPALEDRLAGALREMPEPPVSVAAARVRLQGRTSDATARRSRRIVIVAVTCTLAALLGVVGLAWVRASLDDQSMVADRLPNGLPIGMLEGSLYYTDPGHNINGKRYFRFIVRPDGTGTYQPPSTDGYWDVRFVGTTPGHVMIRRTDTFCGRITDLTLDFRVRGNTVTITSGKAGRCSLWPTIAGAPLVGTRMHWVEKPLLDR